MATNTVTLNTLPIGAGGSVRLLKAQGSSRRRLLDLGLVQDTFVEAVLKSPSGDPIAYNIRGALIALRSEQAKEVLVDWEVQ